jgi:hypothetical protein
MIAADLEGRWSPVAEAIDDAEVVTTRTNSPEMPADRERDTTAGPRRWPRRFRSTAGTP